MTQHNQTLSVFSIKTIFFSLFLFFSFHSFAQKQIVDLSLQELEQKKKEAVANDNMDDAAVYKNAISLRTQMEAAKNEEDFSKAASLKQQLKALKVSEANDNSEKIKKLEEELKKAVAAEDYSRASVLKKELTALKGDKTASKSEAVETSADKTKVAQKKKPVDEENDKTVTAKTEQTGSKSENVQSASVKTTSIPSIEFANQVYAWNKKENSVKLLEYDTPEVKTSTNVGFGYAKATSFWVIPEPKSDVLLSTNGNTSFLVKVTPGMNPVDLFRLVKFEIKGKTNPSRHMAAFTSVSAAYAGGSTSERKDNDMPITYNKVKEGYYEIIVNRKLTPGEYTFYGLGKMYSFSLEGVFSNNSSVNEKSSSGSVTTAHTKGDIYRKSNVTWYGMDLSLCNLVYTKKVGKDEEMKKEFTSLQKQYDKSIPKEKLGAWLGKSTFTEDKESSENLYKTSLPKNWITDKDIDVSVGEIQEHLKNYNTSSKGIGLVLIPERLNEESKTFTVEFVWFDAETKAIIHSQKINGDGKGGSSMDWSDSFFQATKTYVDKFYKKEKGI